MKNDNTEPTLTTGQLEELTSLTGRRLRQLAAAGKIPSPQAGRWPAKPTIQQLFRHYRQRGDGSDSLHQARLRLTRAHAARVEHLNAVKNGTVIDAAAWNARKRLALGALFDELERGFCHDLVPELRRCPDEAAIQRTNREAIERFRTNLIARLTVVDATPV